MRAPAPPRAVVPVLAAAAGVVVAHAGAYAAAFPSAAERHPHLDGTGHGYWPVAVAVAVAAAGLALLLAAGSGAVGGSDRLRSTWRSARSLAGWQAASFVVMELCERTVAGAHPENLLSSPELWLGLVLQLPVAVLAARLLRTAERTGFRLASSLRGRTGPVARRATHRPSPVASPLSAAVPSAARPRAPPLVLATA